MIPTNTPDARLVRSAQLLKDELRRIRDRIEVIVYVDLPGADVPREALDRQDALDGVFAELVTLERRKTMLSAVWRDVADLIGDTVAP